MDFVPRYAKLPADCRLHQEMPAAAARLQAKLRGLDLARLDISDYIERSIGDYVKRLPYTLQKNAFVLLLATAGIRTGFSDMVYYATPNRVVRPLTGPLNLSIRLLGDKWGLLVAPSYVLYGKR